MKKLKLSTWATVLAAATVTTSHVRAENIIGTAVTTLYTQAQWDAFKTYGLVFAYAKATEGYDYSEDSSYTNNMKRGKAAGLQMGAFEFSHLYANTPSQEATYFWNYAGGDLLADGKSLSPMIDFEVFSGHDGTSSYTAWFNDWAADIKAKTSNFMHPVIYCSACAGACDLTTSVTLAAWIANDNGESVYTGNPWSSCDCCNAWVTGCGTGNWTFWDSGTIVTIDGVSVDLDACPFTLAELKTSEGVGGE